MLTWNRLSLRIIAIQLILATTLSGFVRGKVFQKCPLAKALDAQQISRTLISNWVCMANAESAFDTTKKVTLDNRSTSFGIFQINSKDWCREGRKGGNCNKKCEDFLDDDISDDIECAKLIHKDKGFSYWNGWTSKCKQKPLPDIFNCWN
ncbi:lysozyme c-1-like [Uranotaenia lowii]|uniref:lysozyme c-1-like n=1 Tax=Uranotaenia lowii TaxID=190385 RepID=UPI00247A3644|nr:lysozyme c-1-like [Uranotaenia lowii]XP_055606511.1 lysozyme c-1-like [Uranotaenia lowii]